MTERTPARTWIAAIVAVLVIGVACNFTTGVGPLQRYADYVTEPHYQPLYAYGSSEDDIALLNVGFEFHGYGYCPGGYWVDVTMTKTRVVVGTIVKHRPGACAGVGSVGNVAWTWVKLSERVGDRSIVDSRGNPLPTGR
jgi:hypothetical protein